MEDLENRGYKGATAFWSVCATAGGKPRGVAAQPFLSYEAKYIAERPCGGPVSTGTGRSLYLQEAGKAWEVPTTEPQQEAVSSEKSNPLAN